MNLPDTLSFWEKESFFSNIDVAIIGSGIVGLNAALTIKETTPSVSVAIFERGALPEGASTRNAGFACFGSLTELLDDLETMPESAVFDLVEKRFRGLKRLRERVGDDLLNYEALGGYEIFKHDEDKVFEKCADSLSYFNKNIQKIVGRDDTYHVVSKNFGFKNTHTQGIWNSAEGQINTGKMMVTLLDLCRNLGVRFFNGLTINGLSDSNNPTGVDIETSGGWVFTASKVIVATNGFARRLLPNLPVTPARNQVLITKPIEGLELKGCFHYNKGYVYFRNVGNRILLGGGRNSDLTNEMTDSFGTTVIIQNMLKSILHDIILPEKKVEIEGWWSGILGIGSVKSPIVEFVSPNIVVAVRMGGMGVAIGSLVGEEAAHLILDLL
ncbi:MAG: FAD-binding oxidoreductase, partial [Saprospiraceae bacterium]|nr:FAD-binding oxidoreductase [Saprospiraceae bacterium]